eukprot:COSAG04_NODE_420_length_14643_cov_3.634007_13_plen_106_part_00
MSVALYSSWMPQVAQTCFATACSPARFTDMLKRKTVIFGIGPAGGKPAQLEPGNDLTAEEEALLPHYQASPALLATVLVAAQRQGASVHWVQAQPVTAAEAGVTE